ncbi:Bestrophin, RFP-TM, chloride channel-domain-containing protein [Daedaleopsis nitida]|nr:Bestrophin, RFP-TM, chloride channel-domain-containing protein [Daedaleopsis nitida]
MSATQPFPRHRSATGHVLLPAFHGAETYVPIVTTQSLLSWTLGRGTVIWRIWPAVLLHTTFAIVVVSVSLKTDIHLGIPNVMLTLLGMVIGFVISYRASSGYDRYWQGRSAWGDIARTARTLSRLIWIHVPLKLSPVQVNTDGTSPEVDTHVAKRVMIEKRLSLDLVEGFIVALKHHLRGEMGIYYEDLYPLVKPLHEHEHHHQPSKNKKPTVELAEAIDLHPEVPPFKLTPASPSLVSGPSKVTGSASHIPDPIIPPINAYGTFMPPPRHANRSASSLSDVSVSSDPSERRPLLPGQVPERPERRGLFGSVRVDLIPFGSLWQSIAHMLGFRRDVRTPDGSRVDVETGVPYDGGIQRRWDEDDVNGNPVGNGVGNGRTEYMPSKLIATSERLGITHSKHRPRIAGGGENLPLEILRSLSVWLSVLDERGVVPGAVLGGMYGCVAAFEDSLSVLERILTTPLPFVYSVHIRFVSLLLASSP